MCTQFFSKKSNISNNGTKKKIKPAKSVVNGIFSQCIHWILCCMSKRIQLDCPVELYALKLHLRAMFCCGCCLRHNELVVWVFFLRSKIFIRHLFSWIIRVSGSASPSAAAAAANICPVQDDSLSQWPPITPVLRKLIPSDVFDANILILSHKLLLCLPWLYFRLPSPWQA